MFDEIFKALSSQGYAYFLVTIGIFTLIQRVGVAMKYRFTIRSRYENVLICLIVLFVVTFYSAVVAGVELPDYVWVALSRISITWILFVEFYIGHTEASRRNRARALVTIAKQLEGVIIEVKEQECPEPVSTIIDLIEAEGLRDDE